MKNFIRLIGVFLIMIILTIASINVYTKDAKAKETRQAVSESMEKAVTNLTLDDLKVVNESEMADYFVTELATDVTSINKAMDVNIYEINYQEGFIDAEVKAYFNYVFGGSSVKVRRTLYVDEVGINNNIQNNDTTKNIDSNDNLTLNKKGEASSFSGENKFENLVDGDINSYWESNNRTKLNNKEIMNEQSISIDLEKIYSVNRLKIQWLEAYSIKYDVEMSTDKKTWAKIKNVDKGDGNDDNIQFDTTLCRYIKINLHTTNVENKGYKISEIFLYTSYNTDIEFTKDKL